MSKAIHYTMIILLVILVGNFCLWLISWGLLYDDPSGLALLFLTGANIFLFCAGYKIAEHEK